MSQFADYKWEREGKIVLEGRYGFASYSIDKEYVYIEDIFVIPRQRQSGYASRLANGIARIAKKKGCKYMLGSVSPNSKGSHASMLVLIAYGMKLLSSDRNIIYFKKEL